MAPHENEILLLGTREEESVHANAGDNMIPQLLSEEDSTVKTISSMGRAQNVISLVDLAEDGNKTEHDLVPVQEYYCSPTAISSPSELIQAPTTATSAASSISSSFSSASFRLLTSPSSFSLTGVDEDQSSTDRQLQQHRPLHLEDYTQQKEQQQQDDQPTRRRLSLSPRSKAQNWNEIIKPVLMNYLNDKQLQYFHSLYHDQDIASLELLESLAYLASSPGFQEESYLDRLYTLVLHWSSKRKARSVKLSCLKTLMQCLSPPVAGWQHCDPVIEGTLDFLLTPNMEWEFMDHSEMNLLIELRGLCLSFSEKEQARIAKVVRTGETAAVLISASAKLMEEGMIQSGQIIEGHLDKACAKLKRWVKPGQYPLIVDQNAIAAKSFSRAAKRASGEVKDSTLWLVQNARDASSRGLEMVAEKLDKTTNGRHRSMYEQLSPESAEALKAVGKVGMATLGATALVGEAMIETSRALVRKTGSVAADIVEHKYGTDAGQVVLDASATADNLVRAAGNVTLLEHKVLAKSLAKEAGKDKIEDEILRAKDSLHLLEIQMAGIIHQALGNGPATGAMPYKLLEGIQSLKQTQLAQLGAPSPTTASALQRMS
ncbi:MAG: hypothetical protein SGBAC_010299, partial [Bacillariaceae sp.]